MRLGDEELKLMLALTLYEYVPDQRLHRQNRPVDVEREKGKRAGLGNRDFSSFRVSEIKRNHGQG